MTWSPRTPHQNLQSPDSGAPMSVDLGVLRSAKLCWSGQHSLGGVLIPALASTANFAQVGALCGTRIVGYSSAVAQSVDLRKSRHLIP